jgi:hypothetical protein
VYETAVFPAVTTVLYAVPDPAHAAVAVTVK